MLCHTSRCITVLNPYVVNPGPGTQEAEAARRAEEEERRQHEARLQQLQQQLEQKAAQEARYVP